MKLVIEYAEGEYNGTNHTICIEYESKEKLILDLMEFAMNFPEDKSFELFNIRMYRTDIEYIIEIKEIYTLDEWFEYHKNEFMDDKTRHANPVVFDEIISK